MSQLHSITVYDKPACVQCTATKRWLDSKELEYETSSAIDVVDAIKTLLGFAAAPVIKVVNKKTQTITFWTGHNPNELDALLSSERG